MRRLLPLLLAFLVASCDESTLNSNAEADASQPSDVSVNDEAVPDSAPGPLDTGRVDIGVADAANPVPDVSQADDVADVVSTQPDVGPVCEAARVHGVGSPLARMNECGRLSYGLYANQGQEHAVNVLPDFSFAGYMQGGVSLPDVEVVVTLEPEAGDNRQRIQEAIDEVSARPLGAHGSRGAVLLRRGTYRVGNSLEIRASGVVLRGEGQGSDGTVLIATRAEQHDFIVVQGAGSGMGAGARTLITTPVVPVGATSFEVDSAAAFSVGDVVAVERTPNQTWIDALGMAQWGWTPGSYKIAHERKISAINVNTITVDIPLVDTIDANFGGGALVAADLSGRIAGVGVEDLRLVSQFNGASDEDHGWIAVRLERTTNSWVRRVSAVHFGYAAVSLHRQSSFNTIEDCAMLAPISQVSGGRRYAFNVSSGTGNLFQRLYSEQARHDFVSGARTTGPNVWLDAYSKQSTNDDGPHHRWATGLLFDNTAGRNLHVENRQSSGTGHGWSGAQTLFWNGLAQGIRCDAPHAAMNWAVGCVGAKNVGGWAPNEPFGWWESHNSPVSPRSLYLQQLQDRLGPEAVANVTLPAQREGRIWGMLANWGGDGRLEDATTVAGDPTCGGGISAGNVCCAASCGSCGGSGCGSRPGGAGACCTSNVRESGRSCGVVGAPCVLDPVFEAIGVVE